MRSLCFPVPAFGRVLTALAVLLVAAIPARGQTPEVQASILESQILTAYLSNAGSVTIAPGEYRINAASGRILEFDGLTDFTINAYGVTLVATEPRGVFGLTNCHNVTVNGLTIDHDPLPFTQGTIVSKSPNNSSLVVSVHDGYDLYAGESRVIVHDPTMGVVKPETRSGFNASVSLAGGRALSVSVGFSATDDIEIGDFVSLTRTDDRENPPHAVRIIDCTNLAFNDVTVHASNSFAVLENNGSANIYSGLRIEPGPPPIMGGEPRLLSSNADGLHSKNADIGPQVSDAVIRAPGDDGIAINGSYYPVGTTNGGSNQIIVATRSTDPADDVRVGDTVRVFDLSASTSVTAVVTATLPDGSVDWQMIRNTFFPTNNVRDGNAYTTGVRLTLDRPVSVAPGDLISNLNRNGLGFTVTNSLVENTRARGILIKSGAGEVRNSTVANAALAGIVFVPEPIIWFEADFSSDVDIIGNTVRDSGYASNRSNSIQVGGIMVAGPSDWSGFRHSNILIEGNTIENHATANLIITDTDNVTIRDNVFRAPNLTQSSSGSGEGFDTRSVIWVDDADGVSLFGNEVRDLGPANISLLRYSSQTQNVSGRVTGIGETHAEFVEIVADYRDDFQSPNPAPGWAYLWNPTNPIGTPSAYVPLQAGTSNDYTSDGTATPTPSPGLFLRMRRNNVHPGAGENSFSHDVFAIGSYTVTEPGEYAIRQSFCRTSDNTGGVRVSIRVTGRFIASKVVRNYSTASFDADLGMLNAGDRIYVAFGPEESPSFDSVEIDYSIARVIACAADITGDGTLDQNDVRAFIEASGPGEDIFDLLAFLAAFDEGC